MFSVLHYSTEDLLEQVDTWIWAISMLTSAFLLLFSLLAVMNIFMNDKAELEER